MALAWAAGLYFIGSSDSDAGSVIGGQDDERQQLVGLQAARLSLVVVLAAIVVMCLIAAAANDAIWPFQVLLAIIGIAYFTGLHAYGMNPEEVASETYSRLGFRRGQTPT